MATLYHPARNRGFLGKGDGIPFPKRGPFSFGAPSFMFDSMAATAKPRAHNEGYLLLGCAIGHLLAWTQIAFFHLYGLSRDDSDYVMDTFPIVRKNDEKAHGEYRTKRVILEIYNAMAEAARTGTPYQTRLDPSPADPRVAHPDTRPAEKKGAR
jgi:hypothetical protein